jgi:hypothetical protein
VLPTLYATDALVAVERLSYWVDRLAALRTLAAIEARRQAAPAGRSAATPARADRRQRPGAAWTPARSRRPAC